MFSRLAGQTAAALGWIDGLMDVPLDELSVVRSFVCSLCPPHLVLPS